MTAQFISASPDTSDGLKLIRFFKIVGVLGGVLIFARAIIFIAIIGGILFLLI